MQEKMVSNAPGFLCPCCEKTKIRLSLAQFLSSQEVPCPGCGATYHMDKSGCSRLVEMLQDLQIAQQNAELLKGRR